jgi:hypothetical protein
VPGPARGAAAHERPPPRGVGVGIERAKGSFGERRRCVRLEREAGDPVVDGVPKPADVADDRRRTIALRPHLGEAARLVQRRHEEYVGARHEPVLEPVGKVELDTDPVGGRLGQLDQRLLVALFAASEKHELCVVRQERVRAEDEIEPLLRDQPPRHSEQRHLPALRQPERALERGLAAALTVELLGRVLSGDLRVAGRVPLPLVDAVEHADEPVAELEKDVVEPEASAGRPELAGLSGAHRGDEIGEHQPALQEVHLPVPLELMPVVDLPRQPDVGHRLRREVALVPRVVHRQHGRGRRREALAGERGAEIDRDERRMPVVRVQQHRPRHEPGQGRERSQGEERESPRIVGIVDRVLAVDAGPVEILEVLEEEDLRPRARARRAEDPRLLGAAAYRHQERRTDRLEVGLDVAHAAVEGENRGHVEPGRPLVLCQPADGLGETAGAGIGRIFRRHMDDGDGLAARRGQRRTDLRRRAGLLGNGRHPACLMPSAGRRQTTRPGARVRSVPARSPAASAAR